MSKREMMRRSAFAGIAVILMGASLVFPWNVSAHNIDLEKAQELARDYAREVRRESGGKYTHYTTDCYKLFEGHNHYVRCLIEYDNDETENTTTRVCRETLDVYLQPHN